jgi:hypothetical protein
MSSFAALICGCGASSICTTYPQKFSQLAQIFPAKGGVPACSAAPCSLSHFLPCGPDRRDALSYFGCGAAALSPSVAQLLFCILTATHSLRSFASSLFNVPHSSLRRFSLIEFVPIREIRVSTSFGLSLRLLCSFAAMIRLQSTSPGKRQPGSRAGSYAKRFRPAFKAGLICEAPPRTTDLRSGCVPFMPRNACGEPAACSPQKEAAATRPQSLS